MIATTPKADKILEDIDLSDFPIDHSIIRNALSWAHNMRYRENDPQNELFNRLADEYLLDFVPEDRSRTSFKWVRTELGNLVLVYLNSPVRP